MTFLAFRPFRRRKHRNDVIVTSYIKILQILKLKSKDITSKTLHAKFYASRIKNKRIRRGGKIRPPQVWSVFKSPGKIGLMLPHVMAKSVSSAEISTFILLRCDVSKYVLSSLKCRSSFNVTAAFLISLENLTLECATL